MGEVVEVVLRIDVDEFMKRLENELRNVLTSKLGVYISGDLMSDRYMFPRLVSHTAVQVIEESIVELLSREDVLRRLGRKAVRVAKKVIQDEEFIARVVTDAVAREVSRWVSHRTTFKVVKEHILHYAEERVKRSGIVDQVLNRVLEELRGRIDSIAAKVLPKVEEKVIERVLDEITRPKVLNQVVYQIVSRVLDVVKQRIEQIAEVVVKQVEEEVRSRAVDELLRPKTIRSIVDSILAKMG